MSPKRSMTSLLFTSALILGLSACSDNKAPASGEKPAGDASTSGTLDKIKKSGTIVLGYRDSSIPFSYIADNPNQPVGYAHDLQLKVVDAVKQKLNMPDLKVRYNFHQPKSYSFGFKWYSRFRVWFDHQQQRTSATSRFFFRFL